MLYSYINRVPEMFHIYVSKTKVVLITIDIVVSYYIYKIYAMCVSAATRRY